MTVAQIAVFAAFSSNKGSGRLLQDEEQSAVCFLFAGRRLPRGGKDALVGEKKNEAPLKASQMHTLQGFPLHRKGMHRVR